MKSMPIPKLLQSADIELSTCDTKELIGAGYSVHFAHKIHKNVCQGTVSARRSARII